MLDELRKIVDESGPLFGVTYARFENDAKFVTAVGLQFGSLSAVFRAVEDDDTLAVTIGALESCESETLVESSESAPWSGCLGFGLRWAWCLTNQQGYRDGARLEFGDPNKSGGLIVELTVAASAITIFEATRS